jgi:hypothetical protein
MPRRRPVAPVANDPLREKLDQLAERAVDRVIAKGDDATLREITETLKAVDAYHARTRSGGGEAPPVKAWDRYSAAITKGNGADGARH